MLKNSALSMLLAHLANFREVVQQTCYRNRAGRTGVRRWNRVQKAANTQQTVFYWRGVLLKRRSLYTDAVHGLPAWTSMFVFVTENHEKPNLAQPICITIIHYIPVHVADMRYRPTCAVARTKKQSSSFWHRSTKLSLRPRRVASGLLYASVGLHY